MIRRILHVDMDAFYASVEQRDDPTLRGKPVAVGGQPHQRGVVAAASYEARAFGVRSAMSMAKAVRLCPSLLIVRPDFSRYKAASNAVFSIFREVTPLVEPLSLDEAYLDVTENAWGEPFGMVVARRLKERIKAETQLTASAGVAPNKFLAKIASGWQKPDGLTVIGPQRVEPFLRQLPVDALWGVGPVTAKKLRDKGIQRLVDVRTADAKLLRDAVGSLADWLVQLANGVDNRPVTPNREVKSSGSENTYVEDLTAIETVRDEIAEMASHAIAWLARRQLLAKTITIKVRYSDFTTITRSHSAPPTRDPGDLTARAVRLLDKTEAGTRPVRLLGVSVHNFCEEGDLDRLPFDVETMTHEGKKDSQMAIDPWDPGRYNTFQREREQPFDDLVGFIQPAPALRVVDLGCGTGRLTRRLHERLHAAETVGIDRSARMLAGIEREAPAGGLTFSLGTIDSVLESDAIYDIVFSNAVFQWVEDHPRLLRRLAARLSAAGQLAFQVPAMHDDPSHVVADELAETEPFRSALNGWTRAQPVLSPEAYCRELMAAGFVDPKVHLIVYPHVLNRRDDVVEWMKGTLLAEYEKRLTIDLFTRFVEEYRARLLPQLDPGTPFLYPFKRILCWARKAASTAATA